jgi:hypothetical protein
VRHVAIRGALKRDENLFGRPALLRLDLPDFREFVGDLLALLSQASI